MRNRGYLLTGTALLVATGVLILVGSAISAGGNQGAAIPLLLVGVPLAAAGLYCIVQALVHH
jgi:hypothetical protein